MAVQDLSPEEFEKRFREKREYLEVIDVREQAEYDQIRIKGSKLIPLGEIAGRMGEIDWGKDVVLVCRSGSRSGFAGKILSQNLKNVWNLVGGVDGLMARGSDCLEK